MRSAPLLPPIPALRAFEAVARLRGVSRAARELLITQSAVSHHVRKLEQDLGVTLFVRHARGMDLTPAGERYYDTVGRAFALIADGTAALASEANAVVRISVLPSFAAHWLAPRLGRLRKAHPTLTVELDPSLDAADLRAGRHDLAIRYGGGVWDGVDATLLMTERLTPVAKTGSTLADLPLLITRKAFDWTLWSAAAGFDFAAARKVQLTDYNVVAQAALQGEGVALGRLRMMGSALEQGVLTAPYDLVLETREAAYWIVIASGRRPSRAASTVIDWLRSEAAD
ncbi:LysR substrate-binding domain-containing protein [Caulobacter segnis]|nr:LysR substrate-binding domain-containing protein [Caulobacter segnis]